MRVGIFSDIHANMEALQAVVDGYRTEEIDVLLCSGGEVLFSWNTGEIQEMANLLGRPEFDPARWCG